MLERKIRIITILDTVTTAIHTVLTVCYVYVCISLVLLVCKANHAVETLSNIAGDPNDPVGGYAAIWRLLGIGFFEASRILLVILCAVCIAMMAFFVALLIAYIRHTKRYNSVSLRKNMVLKRNGCIGLISVRVLCNLIIQEITITSAAITFLILVFAIVFTYGAKSFSPIAIQNQGEERKI